MGDTHVTLGAWLAFSQRFGFDPQLSAAVNQIAPENLEGAGKVPKVSFPENVEFPAFSA